LCIDNYFNYHKVSGETCRYNELSLQLLGCYRLFYIQHKMSRVINVELFYVSFSQPDKKKIVKSLNW